MNLLGGSEQTHHHSLFAGVGAGCAGVLVLFGLVLVSWHRVGGPVGTAITVIVGALTVGVVGLVVVGLTYAAAWLLYRLRNPEMLASRITLRPAPAPAVAVEPAAPQAIPPSQPVAQLPAGGPHTHYHFDTAEAVQAALEAAGQRRRE